jgi:hypothetical protein
MLGGDDDELVLFIIEKEGVLQVHIELSIIIILVHRIIFLRLKRIYPLDMFYLARTSR